MHVEQYSPERKAEFLLNNAVDGTDYRKARKEVSEGSPSGFNSASATCLAPTAQWRLQAEWPGRGCVEKKQLDRECQEPVEPSQVSNYKYEYCEVR